MKKLLATIVVAACAAFAAPAATVNLSSWSGGTHTLNNGDIATGTLAGNCKIAIASGATVTISNAVINGVDNSTYAWAGLTCNGDATIIVEGLNNIRGFYEKNPGIYVPQGSTLTILGSGTLNAGNNGCGAGIGGGMDINCGNIVISNATVNATGCDTAAGIGGGNCSSCGNITIGGRATVTATGGSFAAGIGSGIRDGGIGGTCGTIMIAGGTINATGGSNACGIGCGQYGSCTRVEIGKGITLVTATGGNNAQPIYGSATDSISPNLSSTSSSTESSTTRILKWDGNLSALTTLSGGSSVTAVDGTTIRGEAEIFADVSIAPNATVTLSGATNTLGISYRWAALTCLGNATIILEGENRMAARYNGAPGVYVPEGCTLTIRGSGSLTAKGGGLSTDSSGGSAGIGGGYGKSCGNIVIESGTVAASGGYMGAGIGSGYHAYCGDITILGGTVSATGGQAAAGIGTGFEGHCGNITISGGTVTSTGYAAGIGCGNTGNCGNIAITGGSTTATSADQNGAGIGSGYQAACGTITISGGIVDAVGNGYGAGIGTGGFSRSDSGAITISGSITRVVATCGEDCDNPIGAGASGGHVSGGVTVQPGLSDVTVDRQRTIKWDGNLDDVNFSPTAGDGTVITGTRSASCLQVNIAPGATVRLRDATLDASQHGIGLNCLGDATIILEGSNYVKGAAGYPGIYVPAGSLLTVKGSGILSAYGGLSAAGIGGGVGGDTDPYRRCGRITIDGGVIYAQGGGHAAGIGSGVGDRAHSDAIRIEERTISVTAKSGSYGTAIGAGRYGSVASVTVDSSLNDDHGTTLRTITSPRIWDGNLDTLTDDDALALDGTVIHGTLDEQCKISIADGATVTLSNATITCGSNSSSYKWAGLTCEGRATIILKGTNRVKGFYENYPGIFVPAGRTLTIAGDGSLTASSSGYGAGIGGGWNLDCGNIRIEGGVISATGGSSAAGIGGGGTSASPGVACGSIEIVGGDVFAQGGGSAAGIGGGNYGTCGNITVGAGIVRVKAQCYGSCPPIGAGSSGSCGTVTVDPSLADDVSSTSVRIITPENWDGNLSTLTRNARALDGTVIHGTLGGQYKISIADGATVTLSNATINCCVDGEDNTYDWAGLTCDGDATIILKDTNTVKGFYENNPGIFVPAGSTLTIEGDGSLDVSSNDYAAGIGGGWNKRCGNIVIRGGTITAMGGECGGAGIGGGYDTASPCGDIIIYGGTITATGGKNGAGIGAGENAPCGNITILGGTITATGGENGAAGVGGGFDSYCGNIAISGGTVDASGGYRAAGIGCGYSSFKNEQGCGDISFAFGIVRVVARHGTEGVNIGRSNNTTMTCGTVTIDPRLVRTDDEDKSTISPWDGNLAALTADMTARDGMTLFNTLGANVKVSIADGATVTLNNAVITNGENSTSYPWAGLTCEGSATIILAPGSENFVKGFYEDWPGIYVPSNKTLIVQGTGALDASSNGYGTGIGGGWNISCGNIIISGGTVTATGGKYAAGIGAGGNVSCGDIAITGGDVTATGGEGANGIGAGNRSYIGTITIGADIVQVVATRGEYGNKPIGVGVDDTYVTVDPSLTDDQGSPTRTITGGGSSSGYSAWATANGVSGAWNATDANGIANVFRYAFNKPTGAFTEPVLLNIKFNEQGKAVVVTPPLVNSEGFTFTIEASDNVDGTGNAASYPLDASGETVIDETGKAKRFFRIRAVQR